MTDYDIARQTYLTADQYPELFAGFHVPTPENTPWGEPGAAVNLHLTVSLDGSGSCTWERNVRHGTWTVESHGLRGLTQPKRGPGKHWNRGLGGFVGISVESNYPPRAYGMSIQFHGKAMEADIVKLENLLRRVASAHLGRIARVAQSAVSELGPVADVPEVASVRETPGPGFR